MSQPFIVSERNHELSMKSVVLPPTKTNQIIVLPGAVQTNSTSDFSMKLKFHTSKSASKPKNVKNNGRRTRKYLGHIITIGTRCSSPDVSRQPKGRRHRKDRDCCSFIPYHICYQLQNKVNEDILWREGLLW